MTHILIGPQLLAGTACVTLLASVPQDVAAQSSGQRPSSEASVPSSVWLSRLPDGETKRQFIIDCTGCHQLDERHVLKDGKLRSEADWAVAIKRMLGFSGPTTSFPVISDAQSPDSTAAWLVRHYTERGAPSPAAVPPGSDRVTEFLFPVAGDLPHDVAVDRNGKVVVTGMFSHKMFTLDPANGTWQETPIPLEQANPRAVEIDANGTWWVVHGGPSKLGKYDGNAWKFFDIGFYAHSVAVGQGGSVFANGHFTREPEQIAEVDAQGQVRKHDLPLHPVLGTKPGGPVPYELRAGPDGRIWMSELQGNRMIVLDPRSGKAEPFTLPKPNSGPRRFDVDPSGIVWIPTYGAGTLVRLDPAQTRFEELALPVPDAAPYVVRVSPTTGVVWIGTGAADKVFSYDPKTKQFASYQLPSRGALVRHLDIDRRNGDVWLAYGESPGKLPARIARLRAR